MTWWGPGEVLKFAKGAGLDNHDAKRAAAIAVAVTGGADHWEWTDVAVPDQSVRGLFAIPAELVTRVNRGNQFDPEESALTIRKLFTLAGGKWGWHPGVKADGGANVKRTLDALDLDGLWTAKPGHMFNARAHLADRTYTSKRIDNYLAQFPAASR